MVVRKLPTIKSIRNQQNIFNAVGEGLPLPHILIVLIYNNSIVWADSISARLLPTTLLTHNKYIVGPAPSTVRIIPHINYPQKSIRRAGVSPTDSFMRPIHINQSVGATCGRPQTTINKIHSQPAKYLQRRRGGVAPPAYSHYTNLQQFHRMGVFHIHPIITNRLINPQHRRAGPVPAVKL